MKGHNSNQKTCLRSWPWQSNNLFKLWRPLQSQRKRQVWLRWYEITKKALTIAAFKLASLASVTVVLTRYLKQVPLYNCAFTRLNVDNYRIFFPFRCWAYFPGGHVEVKVKAMLRPKCNSKWGKMLNDELDRIKTLECIMTTRLWCEDGNWYDVIMMWSANDIKIKLKIRNNVSITIKYHAIWNGWSCFSQSWNIQQLSKSCNLQILFQSCNLYQHISICVLSPLDDRTKGCQEVSLESFSISFFTYFPSCHKMFWLFSSHNVQPTKACSFYSG